MSNESAALLMGASGVAPELNIGTFKDVQSYSGETITNIGVAPLTSDKGLIAITQQTPSWITSIYGYSIDGSGNFTLSPVLNSISTYQNLGAFDLERHNENRALMVNRQGATAYLINWDQNISNAPTIVTSKSVSSISNGSNFTLRNVDTGIFVITADNEATILTVSGDTINDPYNEVLGMGQIGQSAAVSTTRTIVCGATQDGIAYLDRTGTTDFTLSSFTSLGNSASATSSDIVLIGNNKAVVANATDPSNVDLFDISGATPSLEYSSNAFDAQSLPAPNVYNKFMAAADEGRFLILYRKFNSDYRLAYVNAGASFFTTLDSYSFATQSFAGNYQIVPIPGIDTEFVFTYFDGTAGNTGTQKIAKVTVS